MGNNDSFQQSFNEIFKTIETQTAGIMEGVAETFAGKAENLRDGTEFDPVSLPRDLYAHRTAQTEWWYYTGHLETTNGDRFGFEYVFFKRRTDLDKFSLVPLRILGNPIFFAHFAITDHRGRKFRYSHRKSANGVFDLPASMSEKHYHLRIGDWSIRESDGAHLLRASIGDDLTFEATLKPKKPVVLNGKDGLGVSFKDEGEASRYFAYTRMEMHGDLIRNGKPEHFTGSAWMDREFGTWHPTDNQKGWDWFSIQLNDNSELMCYQLRDEKGGVSPFSSGTFVQPDGSFSHLTNNDFIIEPTGTWESPQTIAIYPSGWIVSAPGRGLKLRVVPVIPDQELDTRGTTMIVYWEGACDVFDLEDNPVGRAYVELVGYDRSHDSPNLAYFLMGNSFDFPPKSIFG